MPPTQPVKCLAQHLLPIGLQNPMIEKSHEKSSVKALDDLAEIARIGHHKLYLSL